MADLADNQLTALFHPASIAVIGASDDPTRIGGRPLRYLAEFGYGGAIYPVNPNRDQVQGIAAYPSVGAIGEPVDLAIVAVPADRAVAAIRECADAGVRSVVLFSAGFAEAGPAGAAAQEEVRAIAHASGMRVLGPNCLGVMNVRDGVIATFTAGLDGESAFAGNIAVVSQSGALGSHLFSAARRRGLGFSIWATTGNEVDVDFAECLEHAVRDPHTDVVMVYAEGVRHGARLHLALAEAQRLRKPVVVLKVGSSSAGAAAAASHTGSIVGSDGAYDAVFRHYGALRVRSFREWLDVGEACAQGRVPTGSSIGLITGSGGVGILMADAASACGLDVTPMPEPARAKLLDLLPFAGVANPIDVTAQVGNDPHLFGQFLEVVMNEGGYDALVVFLGHLGLSRTRTERLRPQLKKIRALHPDRLIVLSMLATAEIRADFVDDGFVLVEDASDAVEVVAALARLARLRDASPTPTLPVADVPPMPSEVAGEYGALRLLSAAGLPASVGSVVTNVDSAVAVAARTGGPVAMKVASSRIPHKSDIGGVLLDVEGEAAVSRAYRILVDRAAAVAPGAEHDGVLIAPMVSGGVELLAGIHNDPVVGPVVVLGQGGVTAELHGGAAMRVPPFGPEVARSMMEELPCWPLLDGYRGSTPADTDALVLALVRLSELAIGWREDIASLDINPLVVLDRGDGVMAVDALVVPREPSVRETR